MLPLQKTGFDAIFESLMMSTGWKTVYLFGCRVRTDFPFQIELPPASGNTELTVRFDLESLHKQPPPIENLYTSELKTEDDVPWVRLDRTGGGHLLRIARVAHYLVSEEGVVCWPLTEQVSTVESFLLQVAISFWLEARGRPVLHASCVSLEQRALAFLAFSGTGKSTLATAFLKSGYSLVSDDSLPLEIRDSEVLAWPCHPRIKMTPEQARLFLGTVEDLPRVNDFSDKVGVPVEETWAGSFPTEPSRLQCCYLPERRVEEREVTIEPVRGAASAIELVRHSLVPRLTAAAGMQMARFQLLTRIAEQVPVCRLIYPPGMESLGKVRSAVMRHVAGLR